MIQTQRGTTLADIFRADGPMAQRRFGILLVLLIALLAAPPILLGFGMTTTWFDALMSLLLLAVILSLCFERRQRWFALLLGTPSMLFLIGAHAFSGDVGAWVALLGHLCGVLFLFGTAGVIVKSLLDSQRLTIDSIYGAVCGYLFLGLAWSMSYSMVETFAPGSFEVSGALLGPGESLHQERSVLTYYSFVTLTTVGYGDVSPVSSTTRTLAWIEAVTGQFYLAVIVAGLVSLLAGKHKRDALAKENT